MIKVETDLCQKDCPYFYPMMFGYKKYTYARMPVRKKPHMVWDG